MKLTILVFYATIAIAYGQLFDGRFTVPVDHFRPQDGRTTSFVSEILKLGPSAMMSVFRNLLTC